MYLDASPRPAVPVHCGSGDQNGDNVIVTTDMMDNDSSDGTDTDIDLSIVGTSLQNQQEEPD